MTTLRVSGIPDPVVKAPEIARGLPASIVVPRASLAVQPARAGGALLDLPVDPDDIVEIELEGGLRLWTRIDDLAQDLGATLARGARAESGEFGTDVINVPSELRIGPRGRGWGDWTLETLRIFGLDLESSLTAFVADHVEGRLQPGPGLYRCSESSPTGLDGRAAPVSGGPTLVLLHGTASTTWSSFGGLWTGAPPPIHGLLEQYSGRALAFQHQTLTRSPIENARDLAALLARVVQPGSEIHLVTHSRGGLVGELLARGMRSGGGPFTHHDLERFAGADRARDRDALGELGERLRRAKLAITRFVRVACPARGTTLADGRLDRYFSVLANLAAFLPGLIGNAAHDALAALIAGVLKKRADPRELPGLEAMLPDSPLVQMLNTPGVVTGADLHVIGGDIEGAGVFSRLAALATDFYYRDDHDLVVNTPAMLGGTERKAPVRYWIDTGPEVTHFHYFVRPDTSRRLVAALKGDSSEFHELEAKPFAVTSADYRKRANGTLPIVFVVPGIMGSELSVEGRRVWVSLFALARGGLARLAIERTGVTATGVIRSAYGPLCEYLSRSHEVVPFPYDWRLPLDTCAELLRVALEGALARAEARQRPVRIVAHSMGGLVVRALLATPAGRRTWQRACRHPGARLLMLATPNGGSHAVAAMLLGRDALVRNLSLLDLKHDHAGLLSTIAAFDGVLDLLPGEGTLDLFDSQAWDRLYAADVPADRGGFGASADSSRSAGFAWTRPAAADLERARRLRENLRDNDLDPARTLYVAGVAPETPCDVVINEAAPPGRRVRVMATAHGDGRVPWNTGIPPGIRTYFVDAPHGDLASCLDAFPALLDLLGTGSTSKLPTLPPRRRTAAHETFELTLPLAPMVPDEDEVVASALGGSRAARQRRPDRPHVHVRVVHDNLANAASPVLVGHYDRDLIVGAEAFLDAQLSHRLSALQRMELYAGPPGTAVVVLNEDDGRGEAVHPGAIVAGLGTVGDLTPGSLTSALAQALTAYGAERVGRERRRRQRGAAAKSGGETVRAAVTALLVGSGDAGVTVADSVQALVRAVAQANERLAVTASAPDGPPGLLSAFIDRVDILELYEDRAIEAVYGLRQLARSADLGDFVIADVLAPGRGGRRRARVDAGQAWWQRLRVTTQPDGGLRFEALTQLARADASLHPLQRRVVESFVDAATGTSTAEASLGHTLFELLFPNDFKAYAPDRRRLVLVLDPGAAALPWELLHDAHDEGARPLAVSSGMIRQLLVDRRREPISRAPGNTALVVGDPAVADTRFGPLPGAAAEAQAVAARLTAEGYQVTKLVGAEASPVSVLSALHERPWRVLHLAAHGVFDFTPADGERPVSGLVLDGGLFLTAAEAAQMRSVPELVFVNCCHLGQARGDVARPEAFHRLAANLATEFIVMGARAVVAAGWAVDDGAAQTFAKAFYEEMFAGRAFGDAVAAARQRTYDGHGGTNTWGAYQCYGDVAFSLVRAAPRPTFEPAAAPAEVTAWAEELAERAHGADATGRRGVLTELRHRLATIPTEWWRDASLAAAVAEALGELGEYEEAIAHYETVARAETAGAPVRALEQSAALRLRYASSLLETQAVATQKLRRAERMVDEAEALAHSLLGIGKTSTREKLIDRITDVRARLAHRSLPRAGAKSVGPARRQRRRGRKPA